MIYLASPYSHPDAAVRERRYHEACRATVELVLAGHTVFSPIAYSHPLTLHGLRGDWPFWERFDRAFIERCDSLVVLQLDGWDVSVGVRAEVDIAWELGLPVTYMAAPAPQEAPCGAC